jgi:type II restriction/modification system DNA methylase subunit YeeA
MSSPNPNNPVPNFFLASTADFKKIPGSPIAYWPTERLRNCFTEHKTLGDIARPKQGLATTDNNRFLRFWFECTCENLYTDAVSFNDANSSNSTWFPCQKGGGFRKWFGNNEFVVNWKDNGKEIKTLVEARYGSASKRVVNEHFYFKQGITWSSLSSGALSMRYVPIGFIFETKGSMCFFDREITLLAALGVCNSNIINPLLQCISPTLDYHEGPVGTLPIAETIESQAKDNVRQAIESARSDWNSYETSWDFSCISFLHSDHHQPTLKSSYEKVRAHWQAMTLEMQRLEEENNRIFINAYGLQDELTPDVPLSEITLTCNPHYRYGGNKTEEELETQLLTDTMKELISYSIGCMMGRYRLDRPGLIYAHSGNKDFDEIYHRKNADTPNQTDAQSASSIQHSTFKTQHSSPFPPDDDGIIPILDMPWFSDDAANRFVEFMKAAWPPGTLNENLQFVADTLSPKRGEDPIDTIRRYLNTGFFKDHLKTYKKRPIYWLFSSGRQKAFECLVYLHRYNESTLSRMRSLYVTPLQGNIRSRIEFLDNEQKAAASAADQRKFQKEMEMLKKKQIELAKFDDELRHYADMRISLDLDDGVKVNYGKFGSLLAEVKAITGE